MKKEAFQKKKIKVLSMLGEKRSVILQFDYSHKNLSTKLNWAKYRLSFNTITFNPIDLGLLDCNKLPLYLIKDTNSLIS